MSKPCRCWCCRGDDPLKYCHLFTAEEAGKDCYRGGVTLCGVEYAKYKVDGLSNKLKHICFVEVEGYKESTPLCVTCLRESDRYKPEELY